MKNIAHLFSREAVSSFLDSVPDSPKSFEFIAALMMQRLYEAQWLEPTMIGFYMTPKYAGILNRASPPDTLLLADALLHGIDENSHVDFIISTEVLEGGSYQEFQLKRFGMRGEGDGTEGLVSYLNAMSRKYARSDAACLVAIADVTAIDFPRISGLLVRDAFPFAELMLFGVDHHDNVIMVGLLPEDGWSSVPLKDIVH